MKRLLNQKLIFPLVALVLLVSAFIVSLAGNAIHSHAQAANAETLTAPFANGPTGATTTNSYAGSVQGTCGNPITPYHDGFGLCINNQAVDNYVTAIPPYSSSHTYQFTISVGSSPQQLTFGVCDLYTSDNSGSFTITVKTITIRNISLPSIIWAGYVSHNNSPNPIQYTRADGSWKVPSEPCSSTTKPNALDIWDGLGGTSAAPLEQVGIRLFCNLTPGAGLQIGAWYELLDTVKPPPHFVTTPTAIRPGDVITATTQYLGMVSSTNTCNSDPNLGSPGGNGVYQFSISDSTASWQAVSDRLCGDDSPASRSSADWIVEGHGTLLDFDRVDFSACRSSNGVISTGPVVQKYTMFPHMKAFPSSLSTDGTVFTVYWNHS